MSVSNPLNLTPFSRVVASVKVGVCRLAMIEITTDTAQKYTKLPI